MVKDIQIKQSFFCEILIIHNDFKYKLAAQTSFRPEEKFVISEEDISSMVSYRDNLFRDVSNDGFLVCFFL